ncbi:MAG: hypothetical protein RIR62_2130 [Pseudomonadota bacterium]
MTPDCENILTKAADELFALSLVLALIERGEPQDPTLPAKGLAAVAKCQKLLGIGLGEGEGPLHH